jgi:hypothetical protein
MSTITDTEVDEKVFIGTNGVVLRFTEFKLNSQQRRITFKMEGIKNDGDINILKSVEAICSTK